MSQQRADGMRYAPKGKPNPVVEKGEFRVAAIGLDHGHIYGMCNGLEEAGAEIAKVYDPDPDKVAEFQNLFPNVKPVDTDVEIYEDESIHLVASAAVPVNRCGIGLRAMEYGKDFFSDKPPLTTRQQLREARRKVDKTGQKYMVYYSERLHVEAAVYAGDLIKEGAIGKVIQVINLAPHRLNATQRPDWFWEKNQYGGILVDIGSHQIEQFLFYAGAADARVLNSTVGNYNTPEHPDFQDFGEVSLVAPDGTNMYFRVDWFTPEGLGVWGDGRTFILGSDGYIELRKYTDIGRDSSSDHLYLVNHEVNQHMPLHGRVGFPFFGRLILDCLNRTENAMTQVHAFKVIELAIEAQEKAEWITPEQ